MFFELSVGRRPPDPTWKRPPGRPRTKWTDKLRRDNNNVPIATLWRQAIGRGHSRATLRSEPTTKRCSSRWRWMQCNNFMLCNFQLLIILLIITIFCDEFTQQKNLVNKITVTKISELRQRAMHYGIRLRRMQPVRG